MTEISILAASITVEDTGDEASNTTLVGKSTDFLTASNLNGFRVVYTTFEASAGLSPRWQRFAFEHDNTCSCKGKLAMRNDFLAIILVGDARDALIFQRFAFTMADKHGVNRRVEIEIRGGILATDEEPTYKQELRSVQRGECPFEGQRTFL